MPRPLLVSLALVFSFIALVAQDYRNDMFRTRRASHEAQDSKRAEVTQVEERLRPFYHGVASGDPLNDRVIIWSRVTPENGATSVKVQYRVATDTALTNVVKSGEFTTSSERDFTVKVDVDGLQQGTVYYYGFSAYGRNSLTGRTRTTATNGVSQARFAVVSCSNYPAGYFNAYGTIANRNDLDAVLHLGDYIYEYDADSTSYGGLIGKRLGRSHEPDAELVSLTDYRTRYSQYRLDPDLRRAHQQHPMIHIWDDHESANDSYTNGAENHQPSEGEWNVRKAISKRVCYEWMPTRENSEGVLYRQFSFGTLLDLFMLDTRLDGRDIQVAGVGEGASQASKDSINDPNRRIMSTTQYDWLTQGLKNSSKTWKLIGNQVIFSSINVTPIDTAFLFAAIGPIYSAFVRPQVPGLQFAFESAFYGDVWNNYPAQRANLAAFIRAENVSNVAIVTGDFHSAFAFETRTMWAENKSSVAVEFITPSISAPNFDENLRSNAAIAPLTPALIATIDRTISGLNDHVKWQDIVNHGYELVDFTAERVQCDWYFMDTILAPSSAETWERGYVSMSGTSTLSRAGSPSSGKPNQDIPAPANPPQGSVGVNEDLNRGFTIVGYGPNPTSSALSLTYIVDEPSIVRITIVDVNGREITSTEPAVEHGLHSVVLDLKPRASGRYTIVIHSGAATVLTRIVVSR